MELPNKCAIITGASSGIGFELARQLAVHGVRLIINGRRETLLQAVADELRGYGAEVRTVPGSVTDPAIRATLLGTARAAFGRLDLLINNAGAVRAGELGKIEDHAIDTMLKTNLIAPILLTRAALPLLRADGGGMVVNVASGLALAGLPYYTVYTATKAGLARFGEALRREEYGEGVQVLTVYPAATDTPMMATSKVGPEIGFNRQPPAEVARAMVDAIRSNAIEVVLGGEARAQMIALNRHDPRLLDARLAILKPELREAVAGHCAL